MKSLLRLVNNRISLVGVAIALLGVIAATTWLIVGSFQHTFNPYAGILAYIVAPAVFFLGVLIILGGIVVTRIRQRFSGHWRKEAKPLPSFDLNNPRHRAIATSLASLAILLVLLSSIGSYHAYHVVESDKFCGMVCHQVMNPEFTAHRRSPHANVSCTDCHIGPGASSFFKAKFRGLYQGYSCLYEKYSKPLKTPIKTLRPVQETCYECHWPSKYVNPIGIGKTFTYYSADKSNSVWSIMMLIRVGGSNPRYKPVDGIHWHTNPNNKVEFITSDTQNQEIPWVRTTDSNGNMTVYQTTDEEMKLPKETVAAATPHVMDCMDCHNRPSHHFQSPDVALNHALATGELDASIPYIKLEACKALLGEYKTQKDAVRNIRKKLQEKYPEGGKKIETAIQCIQTIYTNNFFPEMATRWDQFPDNCGHINFPGCFRCHDGEHVNKSGDAIRSDCNSCHLILAQGPGLELKSMTTGGLDFEHPFNAGDVDGMLCDACHTGAPDF